MNTALPFASPDSCPTPGGGDCDPTPVPNGGSRAPLPYVNAELCDPVPIPRYGGECVGEMVAISLPNGQTCNAKDVKAGDSILGMDEAGAIRPQTVLSVTASVQPGLHIVAGEFSLACSTSHLLMTSATETIRADELTFGLDILAGDGSSVKVSQIIGLGRIPVVSWVCEPDHTYIAAGLLNHNKAAIPARDLDI